MKLLFHRYGSICEPDIIHIFQKFGITVVEDDMEIIQKNIPGEVRLNTLLEFIKKHTFSFVFSVNFFPYLSEFCNRMKLPYVCWSVDSPVLELFSRSIRNEYNRIFLFDYAQYERFHPENPNGIFYLPLATNCERWDEQIQSITPADRRSFGADVSFVGSLYTEKSPLERIRDIPDYLSGYINGLVNAQMLMHGYNFLESAVTDELIAYLKEADPHFPAIPDTIENIDRFVAAQSYIGMKLASDERITLLNYLAEHHSVHLFTNSSKLSVPHVEVHKGVRTLTEMPKIFHLSKINLNITMRPIETGLSLRIWDILGCGGFLLTNFQAEIPQYFEIGRDLEVFESKEDLLAKVNYYLEHDDERMEIAQNGYVKVSALHTYEKRLAEMVKVLSELPPP